PCSLGYQGPDEGAGHDQKPAVQDRMPWGEKGGIDFPMSVGPAVDKGAANQPGRQHSHDTVKPVRGCTPGGHAALCHGLTVPRMMVLGHSLSCHYIAISWIRVRHAPGSLEHRSAGAASLQGVHRAPYREQHAQSKYSTKNNFILFSVILEYI